MIGEVDGVRQSDTMNLDHIDSIHQSKININLIYL
jgi:hypothetical protein